MTKEEILDKHHNLNLGMLSITEKQIQAAMDDYAKQEAIAFRKWMEDGKWNLHMGFSTPTYYQEPPTTGKHTFFAIEQLYSLFLEQK